LDLVVSDSEEEEEGDKESVDLEDPENWETEDGVRIFVGKIPGPAPGHFEGLPWPKNRINRP